MVEKYESQIFGRIFSYANDKVGLFVVGIILALANGVIFPLFSIYLAEMLIALITLSTPQIT